MKQLRWSIAALVLNLALLFNLERLDFNEENIIDIQSFVYILATVIVLSTLTLPIFRRVSVQAAMMSWLGVYMATRGIAFRERPWLGGIFLYLTITEIVLLLITALISWHVAQNIQDFEQAIANITLPKARRRVRVLDSALEDIQTEMVRSRRHKRALSVVVVKPEPQSLNASIHRTVREVQEAMLSRYVASGLLRVTGDTVRRLDTVIQVPNAEHIIVLSPETNAAQARVMVERLRIAASQQLGIEVRCGIASFPENALTFEELVRVANRNTDVSLPDLHGEIALPEQS